MEERAKPSAEGTQKKQTKKGVKKNPKFLTPGIDAANLLYIFFPNLYKSPSHFLSSTAPEENFIYLVNNIKVRDGNSRSRTCQLLRTQRFTRSLGRGREGGGDL